MRMTFALQQLLTNDGASIPKDKYKRVFHLLKNSEWKISMFLTVYFSPSPKIN